MTAREYGGAGGEWGLDGGVRAPGLETRNWYQRRTRRRPPRSRLCAPRVQQRGWGAPGTRSTGGNQQPPSLVLAAVPGSGPRRLPEK